MIRKATIRDVPQIFRLINGFATKNLMIQRSLNELYENIRDFWVFVEGNTIIACCALHVVGWQRLAEIKSLAVKRNRQRMGIGTQLVETCIKEAKTLGIKFIFALTYTPSFFKTLKFKRIPKSKLPHKIWSECYKCPKFPCCEEEALVRAV